jgi:hypothetical protein
MSRRCGGDPPEPAAGNRDASPGSLTYEYRPEVLDALVSYGVRPRPSTPPARVRDFLNDLYRYEIRRLKRRLLCGDFPQGEYSGRVVELRRRYSILSLPLQYWTP